jgi:hypothetical protein
MARRDDRWLAHTALNLVMICNKISRMSSSTSPTRRCGVMMRLPSIRQIWAMKSLSPRSRESSTDPRLKSLN